MGKAQSFRSDNTKHKKLIYIISSTIITIILLYSMDQILHLNYISKVAGKIIFFSLFPLIYIRMTGENFIKDSIIRANKHFHIKMSHILGISLFILLIIAFNWLKQYMNIAVLISEFEEKYKINKGNILYYGTYLTLINSLLEEFFFRGFIFLNIKGLGKKAVAYGVSSIAFSLYHISNFQNWLNLWVFVLATIGLFIGGMIFNYLDDQENTFLNSWFVHICADLAIVGFGFSLF